VLPYFHWIFPYVKLRQSGDRVIENGLLANTFEGFGLGNGEFGSGPDDRWEFPVASERPYSYARSSWAPSGLTGFYTWHGLLTAAVSNKALVSNVATLTTSTPHGFEAGDSVTVTAVGAPFDGTYTILTVPSTTTFTYARTNADVTSAVATGTVSVAAGARAVTDLPDGTTTTDFNVPGNVDYSSDLAVDNVISSSEDPVA
jgi:hypothetical protein